MSLKEELKKESEYWHRRAQLEYLPPFKEEFHRRGDLAKRALQEIERLTRRTAILKVGWKRPKAPKCQFCGREVDLIAHNTGEGWYLCWDEWCDNCSNYTGALESDPQLIGEKGWPFLEDYASPKDFEAIGIRVE